MLYINAKPGDKLNLGRKGENRARTILFDISQWRKLYGDGVVALLHQRAGDAAPYPCDIETDGNTVAWAITASDTAVASQYGKYELQYRVNDQLAKSATGAASVYESLGESVAEPPEPQQGWVDKVLQAGADAEAAANRAEEAAIRQPYPNEETGTWWLWDAEKGEYVDSGVPSGGEGSGGTTDHDKLRNRDAADQHPMSAIAGLEKALEEKQPKGSYLTTDSLGGAVNDALAQAKESGEFDGDDYVLTDADKREIAKQAAELVEIPEGGTTGDYIPVPPTAEVGQTIIVKSADENGKPTEWEAAELSLGFGTDGKLYIMVSGTAIGDGVEINGEIVQEDGVAVFVADFTGSSPSAEQFYSWEGRVYDGGIYDALANIVCSDGVVKLTSVYDSENSRWVKQMMNTGGLFESDNFICTFRAKFSGLAGSWNNVITYGTGTHWTDGMYSDGVKWPAGGEIDAFEQAGGYASVPNTMYTPTAHYGSGTESGYPNNHEVQRGTSVEFTTDEWHDFKFSLKNGYVKVWIDDVLVGESDFSGCSVSNNYLVNYQPFLKPQAFYIDGSCASGNSNTPTENVYEFEVSDFKVYQDDNLACTALEIYPQMWDKGTDLVFPVGAELYLERIYNPANTSNKACTWQSSDESVATVVQGYVKTLAEGEATITARCGSVSAQYLVKVAAEASISCAKITCDKTSIIVAQGNTAELTMYKYPAFATDEVVLKSADENVCTVSGSIITGTGAGETTITAVCGAHSFVLSVQVNAAKTPYAAYDFTVLAEHIDTEPTDDNTSILIPNTGTAGEVLDLTATAYSRSIVGDTVRNAVIDYSAKNVELESTLNLKTQPLLYLLTGLDSTNKHELGAYLRVFNNGTNANVMPSCIFNQSTVSIRCGSVDAYTADNPGEVKNIAIYHNGSASSVFINGEKVVSGGDVGYITTAFSYFNILGLSKNIGSFKMYIGDTFTDEELITMTAVE